ncbi:hypothetical protein D9615_008120 [Tricholomella constricta]|uniref:HNH nuclease domain-containing protein n=1 Tax=Tricholomella constricta TaxID=117010 RepID=A0A8H5GW19_9AGAR|nr:hypothetical protein D9615_008120 [Tricholomella constricta]
MISTLTRNSLLAYSERAKGHASGANKKSHAKAASLLIAMLDHAPTPDGREEVAHAITACQNDDQLYGLYDHYLKGLLIPMKAQGGRTPAVSDHPSRRSAEITRENLASLIESAKRDQQTLKDLCLKRDGARCVISGIMDMRHALKHLQVYQPGDEYKYTEAAHIIPFGINKTHSNQARAKSAEIITLFTGIDISEVNGNDINRLENVMTLSLDEHKKFGGFDIWLEPLEGQQNAYKLGKANPFASSLPAGTIIQFTDNQTQLPLPDPRYLALHAACAKIAHASGAAETIDAYLRDLETTKVLAEDGSSMAILDAVSQALATPAGNVAVSAPDATANAGPRSPR